MKSIDVKMADISSKPVTLRGAVARARICLKAQTVELIKKKEIPKGDVVNVAQCAGILAAKRVDELIPLCHSLPLEHIEIDFKFEKEAVIITATVKTKAKTGVEMEAMVACSFSALTIYDMCKPFDRGAVIKEIKLMQKWGGKSGQYKRK